MMSIHIFGGGTFSPVRTHLALAAPAFGGTARRLGGFFEHYERRHPDPRNTVLHLTQMAGGTTGMVTNADVADEINELIAARETRVIVMNAALCDYEGVVNGLPGSATGPRLRTADGPQEMRLVPADKVIGRIRKERKDIFVVGFKTSRDAGAQEQYLAGLRLLKQNSLNLVLANDLGTGLNMVITPEEARYGETADRQAALQELVEITCARSRLTFTRSRVVDDAGDLVRWDSYRVPSNLRAVVNHAIARGAYQPFNGATVGHFAVKDGPSRFLTSLRKRDFNQLAQIGLVEVEAAGPDEVIAYGARPSVGGQSQRMVFADHPEMDCIFHAHVPLRPDAPDAGRIPHRSQRLVECGSHECGKQTSQGLAEIVPGVKAVMLDNHGPNVVFSRKVAAATVIRFIEANFDLTAKTGGGVHE